MKIVLHARQANLAEDFKGIVEEKLHSMNRFSVTIDRVEVGNNSRSKSAPRKVFTPA
ncbi:MAG: hypothetical protein WDO06_07510 [Actinomycetota bacterium]